ncbi:MAG: hypothetical protein ACKN9V_07305 [Pseudomonadota bacterium]
MKFSFLSLVVLNLVFQSLASADVFRFYLNGFPKEDRNCHSQTASIAQKFEEGTQTKVMHVECVSEHQTSYDFLIEYEASEKLEVVSTDDYSVIVGSRGRHKEKADCLKALPLQTEIFFQATGLTPFFTYCRSLELSAGKNWEIIITATGKPKLKPEMGTYLMFAKPILITFEEIYNGLKIALSKQGAILSDLVFQYSAVMGTGEGDVHYFSTQPLHFSMERVTKVPTESDCARQVQEAKSFLGDKEKYLFTIYCGDRQFGAYDLHLGFIEKPNLEWRKSVDKFQSFSECSAQKEQVLKNYQGSMLNPLLGGLCSQDYETRAYHVILFKQKL